MFRFLQRHFPTLFRRGDGVTPFWIRLDIAWRVLRWGFGPNVVCNEFDGSQYLDEKGQLDIRKTQDHCWPRPETQEPTIPTYEYGDDPTRMYEELKAGGML